MLYLDQYLASKVEQEGEPQNELTSTGLSLLLAMRGMENENAPDYSAEDLKEKFS
jgi:hypothetical protein